MKKIITIFCIYNEKINEKLIINLRIRISNTYRLKFMKNYKYYDFIAAKKTFSRLKIG